MSKSIRLHPASEQHWEKEGNTEPYLSPEGILSKIAAVSREDPLTVSARGEQLSNIVWMFRWGSGSDLRPP